MRAKPEPCGGSREIRHIETNRIGRHITMNVRYFALIFGVVFLLVGIAGFIPALVAPVEAPAEHAAATTGHLFGLFPINPLHNIVHILFGIGGIAAYRSFSNARLYARVVAIAYAALMVFGLIPGLNTLFGLVPLYGHDVWLHAVLAAVAAYFGFFSRPVEDRAATATGRL
jgi:hypothetical protein